MSDTTTLAPVLAGHIAAVPRLGQPGNALGVDPHTGRQRVTPDPGGRAAGTTSAVSARSGMTTS